MLESHAYDIATLTVSCSATPDDVAKRLAELYVDTGPKDGFDAFVVLVRSIASKDAGPLLMARPETITFRDE